MTRDGFTLIEVVVALIILEVGLLGVAALALHAHGVLSDASLRSQAVAVAEEVADSLGAAGARSGGTRPFLEGSVSWTPDEALGGAPGISALRRVSVAVEGADGEEILRVWGIVPYPGGAGSP